MAAVTFIESNRGGKIAVFQNFMYKIDKRIDDVKTYWKCAIEKSCKARLCLVDSFYKSNSGFHNHVPHPRAIESRKFHAKLKKRAQEELATPVPKIYKEEIAQTAVSAEAASNLPSFSNMSRRMYRARSSLRPSLPKNIANLKLDGVWLKAKSGKNFLLVDDGKTTNRILIFCTVENLQKLCSCNRIFMDGTFKIVPKIFTQLYTIHGMYMGQMFPYAYCLLQNKSRLTYRRVLELLKAKANEQNLEFNPESALIDFEASAIKALLEVFPNIIVKGCFFHYAQCIWRKVQQLGLAQIYRRDEVAQKWIRRAVALPLVPEDQVTIVFLWLRENAPNLPQADLFHTYLLETWLDEVNPIFTRDTWNHFANNNERTNNHVEGWHSKLNKKATAQQLNIFAFIELIKQDQAENEAAMWMLLCGNERPPKQQKKYRKLNEKLSIYKNKLLNHELSLHEYVDVVSYIIRLKD